MFNFLKRNKSKSTKIRVLVCTYLLTDTCECGGYFIPEEDNENIAKCYKCNLVRDYSDIEDKPTKCLAYYRQL